MNNWSDEYPLPWEAVKNEDASYFIFAANDNLVIHFTDVVTEADESLLNLLVSAPNIKQDRDRLASAVTRLMRMLSHYSEGGQYAIVRTDGVGPGFGEQVMIGNIFEEIENILNGE